MPEASIPASTPDQALRYAPWTCVASLAGILLIWALHGLYFVAVVMAPIAGFMALGFLVGYWRTKKDWLSGMPWVALMLPVFSLSGASLWNVLLSVGLSLFFMNLPLWLFGRAIVRWAAPTHS